MLSIAKTHAILGKVANNIEYRGDEEVTAFDIPVSGILLDLEQVKTLLDDPYADRWLFNETKSGAIEPVTRALEPRVLKDAFEGAKVCFHIGKAEFTLTDCKIQGVTLDPENGGNTKVNLKLRVRPESDKQILLFMGHQNREVSLEIAEAKVSLKGNKKQLDAFDDTSKGDEKGDGDKHTAAGLAQADALARSKPSSGKGAAH
jgi:hypothetical protein